MRLRAEVSESDIIYIIILAQYIELVNTFCRINIVAKFDKREYNNSTLIINN